MSFVLALRADRVASVHDEPPVDGEHVVGDASDHPPAGYAQHLPMLRAPMVVVAERVHIVLPILVAFGIWFAAQVAWFTAPLPVA